MLVSNLRSQKQKDEIVVISDRLGDRVFIRCDRASVLGNPFDLKDKKNDIERAKVVQAYREWLWENIKLGNGYVKLDKWVAKGFKIAPKHKIARAEDVVKKLYDIKNIEEEINPNTGHKKYKVFLLCWCAPLPCHADIIKNAVSYLSSKAANSVTVTNSTNYFIPKKYNNPKIFIQRDGDFTPERAKTLEDKGCKVVYFDSFSPVKPIFKAGSVLELKNLATAYKIWLKKNINATKKPNAKSIADDYKVYLDPLQYTPTPNEIREFFISCLQSTNQGLYLVASNTEAGSPVTVFRNLLLSHAHN